MNCSHFIAEHGAQIEMLQVAHVVTRSAASTGWHIDLARLLHYANRVAPNKKRQTRDAEDGDTLNGLQLLLQMQQTQRAALASITSPGAGRPSGRVRRAILDAFRRKADGPLWCKAYCGSVATVVDHIVSLRNCGDNNRGNLQPLCHSCNSIKAGIPFCLGGDKPNSEALPGFAHLEVRHA